MFNRVLVNRTYYIRKTTTNVLNSARARDVLEIIVIYMRSACLVCCTSSRRYVERRRYSDVAAVLIVGKLLKPVRNIIDLRVASFNSHRSPSPSRPETYSAYAVALSPSFCGDRDERFTRSAVCSRGTDAISVFLPHAFFYVYVSFRFVRRTGTTERRVSVNLVRSCPGHRPRLFFSDRFSKTNRFSFDKREQNNIVTRRRRRRLPCVHAFREQSRGIT